MNGEIVDAYNIGLMGLVINNGNMGCVALTYSFILIMEEIGRNEKKKFIYYIFEDTPDNNKIQMMISALGLQSDQVISIKYKKSFSVINDIKKCRIVFDFTEGDSFSDIYGNKRFLKNSFYKYMVLKSKIDLVIGPQTIGPFVKAFNRRIATKILSHARQIYSSHAFQMLS